MVLMVKEDLLDQAGMERAFRGYFEDIQRECGGTLNHMLDMELLCCSYEEKTAELSAKTMPWMANPGGITHGGIIDAYLDVAMGLLCRYFSNGHMTVSIHMDVNYLKAIPIGTELRIGARLTKAGSSICFVEGYIRDGEGRRLFATAGGAYSVAKAK